MVRENLLKTITADEARELVELTDLGIRPGIAKKLSEKIYRLAKMGKTEATIQNIPDGYIVYLRHLGYDVIKVTDNLIQISWL